MSSASTWYSCMPGRGDRHRAPVRARWRSRRAAHQRELVRVLDEPHRVERRAHVDDLRRAPATPVRARSRTSFRSSVTCAVPVAEQAERRVTAPAGPTARSGSRSRRARRSDAPRRSRRSRARRRGRSESRPRSRAPRSSRGRTARGGRRPAPRRARHRFGLGESRQVIEIAVVPERIERIAVARDLGRRRHERKRRRRVRAHRLQQRVAARAVELVGVVHRGILHVDRAL